MRSGTIPVLAVAFAFAVAFAVAFAFLSVIPPGNLLFACDPINPTHAKKRPALAGLSPHLP